MTAHVNDFPMTARDFAEEIAIERMSPDVWHHLVENLGYDKAEECARDLERTARDLLLSIPDRLIGVEAATYFTMFVSLLAYTELEEGLNRGGEDPRPPS